VRERAAAAAVVLAVESSTKRSERPVWDVEDAIVGVALL